MTCNVDVNFLVEKAKSVLGNSYAPYSNIHVASAVLTKSGRVYLGVNVENSSYGLTICAERSAISSMVTHGERELVAVAVVTDMDKPIPPCGACRQVIAEFNPEATIIMHSVKTKETIVMNLKELYPQPFKLTTT
ncbi:MAG TPA: cytidine deaminase [Desulfurococcales archaeon]|nr:cytidine deaminase [Desulfurococcales archaeon]